MEKTTAFADLTERVNSSKQLFNEFAGDILSTAGQQAEENTEEQAESGGAVVANAAPVRSSSASSDRFSKRDDVAMALDSVMRFYQKHEPSSPVPILIARAREMVYKNFFDLLRELAPQHKDSFRDMMRALNEDPLAFLIEDSYNSFLNGESFTVPEIEAEQSESSDESTQQESAPEAPAQDVADSQDAEDGGDAQADENADSAENAEQESASSNTNSSAPVTLAPAQEPARTREIDTRDEVLATLTQVQAFFERNEPSSPVPLIVQKVRNLVPKNFLDLLAEFDKAPDEESD